VTRENKKTYSDTPTSGNISISVDESYKPIVDSQVYTFQSLYHNAHINVNYQSEAQAVKDLINDSGRLIIINRKLTDEENKYFENIKLKPRVVKIATDAVAFILNKKNQDTLLALTHFKDILNNKINTWQQINNNSKLGKVLVVFDKDNSGNARLIKEKFLGAATFPSNCFAVNSNAEVIDYVNKNENAIGVISVSWISDRDDPETLKFLDKITVAAIAEDTTASPDEYYKPYQAYIAQGTYPLCREVYSISREARTGLGTGFVSFVAGEKGQRIILKSGIVPGKTPLRIIETY